MWARAALAALFLSSSLGGSVARAIIHDEGRFVDNSSRINRKPQAIFGEARLPESINIIDAPKNINRESFCDNIRSP
jgi:hypothetical protein